MLLLSFLTSCGSNDKGNIGCPNITQQNSNNFFSFNEKQFICNLFQTEYLWADQVELNKVEDKDTASPQQMLDTLKVTPPYKWSFSLTKKEYDDFTNQKTEGFGFGYHKDFTIFLVRIGSPAYNKLYRGDKILRINGEEASYETLQKAKSTTRFTVLRNGEEKEVSVTASDYTFQVTLGKVLTQNNTNIGYLRYDSFTSSSIEEFEKEFTKFKAANISELIIDLRYNGGGSVAVASTLLDNITNQYSGKRQGYMDWNDNNKNQNQNFSFSDEVEPNDLNMKRVIFLVTKNSASASELVISALKPYLGNSNVITIGDNTHGKNVGMSGKSYGSNYYFLINFFIKNAAGEKTSFDGIPATCTAEDDITHRMGDENEAMLHTALSYLTNGTCP